jgi:hypothetical protein
MHAYSIVHMHAYYCYSYLAWLGPGSEAEGTEHQIHTVLEGVVG